MFDALLRLQLAPIVERLAQMETQLEDLYRRAESFCRIGVCQEVDAASNTCKVRHGELLTPAIRFFNPSAGAQTETRIPTVGEQCLLLNYGGGEGGGQSVALFGLNSDRFPPLSSVASLTSQRVVEVGIAPFKTLRQRCQSETEARSVAQGELRRVGREGLSITIDCPGNPLLSAEGLLLLDETWPGYMQGRWSIDKVTHVGDTTTGYRSSIMARGLAS